MLVALYNCKVCISPSKTNFVKPDEQSKYETIQIFHSSSCTAIFLCSLTAAESNATPVGRIFGYKTIHIRTAPLIKTIYKATTIAASHIMYGESVISHSLEVYQLTSVKLTYF